MCSGWGVAEVGLANDKNMSGERAVIEPCPGSSGRHWTVAGYRVMNGMTSHCWNLADGRARAGVCMQRSVSCANKLTIARTEQKMVCTHRFMSHGWVLDAGVCSHDWGVQADIGF